MQLPRFADEEAEAVQYFCFDAAPLGTVWGSKGQGWEEQFSRDPVPADSLGLGGHFAASVPPCRRL